MHRTDEYRGLFIWLDEYLKRLMGEAEDIDVGILDALDEEESASTGVVSLVRDNGIQWLRDSLRRLKEHINSIEEDISSISRLEIEDRIELGIRAQFRRIREDEESLERLGKTDEWYEEEDEEGCNG